MKKTDCETIKLGKGEINRYHSGDLSLYVYKTNDPIEDVSLILEKGKRALVIEPPCFVENLTELEEFLRSQGFKAEGLILAYHMTGAHFIREAKRYSTRNAEDYGTKGAGKATVDKFADTFGSGFDPSLNRVTGYIEGDSITIAGITLNIERTPEAFDIEIPALNAKYIHMLGHDVHSIIIGTKEINAQLARLEVCVRKGYELILTSHYPPEDLEDVKQKIGYLKKLHQTALQAKTADEFKVMMQKQFPEYRGEHYLNMTAQALFG